MKILFLSLAVVTAAWAADQPDTNSVSGTWTWDFTMPDGTVVHPKIKLVHKNAQLRGVSIIRPGTDVAITNATIAGDKVRFEVVRVHNGIKTVTRYAGQWSGDTITGTIESNWAGEPKSYAWEARRRSSLTGNWKWTSRAFGGRRETRAKLVLEGNELTGTVRGREGRDTKIKNGLFENGEVSFEVEREREGVVTVQKYKGVFEGGTIVGTVAFVTDDNEDNPTAYEWNAERVD